MLKMHHHCGYDVADVAYSSQSENHNSSRSHLQFYSNDEITIILNILQWHIQGDTRDTRPPPSAKKFSFSWQFLEKIDWHLLPAW